MVAFLFFSASRAVVLFRNRGHQPGS
jgi:hypothetical protein